MIDLVFDWDAGNRDHIARHTITSDEAEQVIANDPLDLTIQLRNGEQRLVQIGETLAGRILVVVTTLRDYTIRVVTAHPANRELRHFYANYRRGLNVEDDDQPGLSK